MLAVEFASSEMVQTALRGSLERLVARYLVLEKKRGVALDPVANFHIRNGAELYQVNWMGNPTPKGLAESFGIMVNYRYVLANLEHNNSAYLLHGRVTTSDLVRPLLPAS